MGNQIDRVVINIHGDAVPPFIAKSQYNIEPYIVFIRKDGWSLGAPKDLQAVAFGIWKDEWTLFYYTKKNIIWSIKEYILR